MTITIKSETATKYATCMYPNHNGYEIKVGRDSLTEQSSRKIGNQTVRSYLNVSILP